MIEAIRAQCSPPEQTPPAPPAFVVSNAQRAVLENAGLSVVEDTFEGTIQEVSDRADALRKEVEDSKETFAGRCAYLADVGETANKYHLAYDLGTVADQLQDQSDNGNFETAAKHTPPNLGHRAVSLVSRSAAHSFGRTFATTPL